jgi:hypothetical protein
MRAVPECVYFIRLAPAVYIYFLRVTLTVLLLRAGITCRTQLPRCSRHQHQVYHWRVVPQISYQQHMNLKLIAGTYEVVYGIPLDSGSRTRSSHRRRLRGHGDRVPRCAIVPRERAAAWHSDACCAHARAAAPGRACVIHPYSCTFEDMAYLIYGVKWSQD